MPTTIADQFTLRPGSKGQPERTFGSLPLRVKAVVVTMTASAVLGGASGAPDARFDAPFTFLGLLAASVILAASKVRLPLLPSAATLSLSYCANFASLALLGAFKSTLVVAAGACAFDGGLYAGSYACADGVATAIPVDLLIRGCPPTPATLLKGLLALMARSAR